VLAMPLPARARTGLVGHDPDDCVAKIVNVKMGTDPFILSRGGGSFGVLATWVICSQNRRLQNDLTRDKHPRKPTHNVRKNRKDARKFRS
jgi:hypothetical protein